MEIMVLCGGVGSLVDGGGCVCLRGEGVLSVAAYVSAACGWGDGGFIGATSTAAAFSGVGGDEVGAIYITAASIAAYCVELWVPTVSVLVRSSRECVSVSALSEPLSECLLLFSWALIVAEVSSLLEVEDEDDESDVDSLGGTVMSPSSVGTGVDALALEGNDF